MVADSPRLRHVEGSWVISGSEGRVFPTLQLIKQEQLVICCAFSLR